MEKINQPFFNDWVDVQDLPASEEAEFIGLESEYLYVRLSSVLIMTIIGGLTLLFVIFLTSWTWTTTFIIIGVFLLLMIFWAVLVILEFRYRGYVIRSKDIAYRSGYIFRRRQYLPFRRVQHCKITEGLIERLFHFSTVIVSAAGDDIIIHGLRPDDAEKLQHFINEKVDELTKEMHYGNH